MSVDMTRPIKGDDDWNYKLGRPLAARTLNERSVRMVGIEVRRITCDGKRVHPV